ncbi:Structural maintenance of chromosomes protein 1 [Orbilia oligospora]|uniref:Structural maintenance of chromosomes protein n=1 Tax=Orbilia oligospora TaxID=2813651 RepID=A0A7C8VKY0_ORBOL|nr:Structural maintenance of chromosomes protein 1 [Orbilia oligospora]
MGKLKRLELNNFKSYKGHQKIEFGESYFTSIIGPNGSGKSNSMDAISFVLGIKSAQLRSASLKDLVYRGRVLKQNKVNGTIHPDTNGEDSLLVEDIADASASQADPKTAWVMAVYEDDDGEEHHWKRLISSSGASEYRINNRVVTAAEYNAALEKENILIKARNFLVFQGDVEAVASQSPKDLTRLIEQISGSLEWKSEYERLKIEQDRAIEHSNANLNKRRGINAEIKQYQEQKREAENYERKANEKDQAIITHVLWKLFHFQKTMEDNKAKIAQQQAEMRLLKHSYEKDNKVYEQARAAQAVASRTMSKKEKEIKKKEAAIEDKEVSLLPVDEKIKAAQGKVQAAENRIREINRDHDNQKTSMEDYNRQIKIVKTAQAKFEADQAKAAAQSGVALSSKDLAEYAKLREQFSTKAGAENMKLEGLEREAKTETETLEALRNKVAGHERRLEAANSELQSMKANFEDVDNEFETANQEVHQKKKELKLLNDERAKTQQAKMKLESQLQEALKKLHELDDGRKQNEKEIKMRETVATLKRLNPGVKGRISDLCKPKLKKYQDAVSTALGRHFDAIAVDNEKTAHECIRYLKEHRVAVATFIPMETIVNKPLNSSLKGMHRGMRMAIDTIDYDPSVERAMLYACGNTVVCETIEVAKYICYEKKVEVKAVTLDGTVIHKGGMMTGGRVDKKNARRWDETEADGFRKLVEELKTKIQDLDRASYRPEEESLRNDYDRLEKKLSGLREERDFVKNQVDDKTKFVSHLEKELSGLRPELNNAEKTVDGLERQIEKLRAGIHRVQDGIFKDFCKKAGLENIRSYEETQGSLEATAAQKRLEFNSQLKKLTTQLQFEKDRIANTQTRLASLEGQVKTAEKRIKEFEKEKAEVTEELEVLNKELEALKEDFEAASGEIQELAEKVAAAKRDVSKRSKEMENVGKIVTQLESDIERTSTNRYALLRRCKLEEINIPLTAESEALDAVPIEDALAPQADPDAMDVDEDPHTGTTGAVEIEDFGVVVDFSNLDEDLQTSGDDRTEEDLLDRVKTIESELEKLSPNSKAVERLAGVEDRLQETEKEFEKSRRDAKAAKDRFLAVKEKRTQLFNKAFSHISDQIGKVYKDLTKSKTFPLGGTAYLDVEDQDEPYLDGIKYHAMPPMKRFRDMEHLSGGEKTMAALALLFAIHSYQSSPFFVLDEVDAALDNANVQKIANYICNNCGPGFQFIVISLKTGLFQQSQALVGIYRDQVENSSKSLTLDLRKYVEA